MMAATTLRQPQARDLPADTAYCASDRAHFVRGPFSAPQAFDTFAAIVGPMLLDETEHPELTCTLWDSIHEGHTEGARCVRDHLMGALRWPVMNIRVMPDNTVPIAVAKRIGATRTDAPAPDRYPGCLTDQLRGGAA